MGSLERLNPQQLQYLAGKSKEHFDRAVQEYDRAQALFPNYGNEGIKKMISSQVKHCTEQGYDSVDATLRDLANYCINMTRSGKLNA